MGKYKNNRALTLIEVLFVFFILLIILVCIIIPSFSRIHEHSRESWCSASLNGIGISLAMRAEDYNENTWYKPSMMKDSYCYDVLPGSGDGTETWPDRTMPIPVTTNNVHTSPTRLFWDIIRTGDNDPKLYICRVSCDIVDPTNEIEKYYDFSAPSHVSYSYNVSLPWQDTKTLETCSSRIPVVADKGPFINSSITAPPSTMTSSTKANQWAPYNSPNHQGKGQNVLFADNHIEELKTPVVPSSGDNIYTTAASCTNSNTLLTGVSMWTARDLPYDWYDPKHNPYAATDSLIFP